MDGVFFTTRKYLLVFATVPALLFLRPSSPMAEITRQSCKMLFQSLAEAGEQMRHAGSSSKDSGTCWGRLCLTKKHFLED